MGGDVSHAYMAYAEAGEDEIVFCTACGYAANVELAGGRPRRRAAARDRPGRATVARPDVRTIDQRSASSACRRPPS